MRKFVFVLLFCLVALVLYALPTWKGDIFSTSPTATNTINSTGETNVVNGVTVYSRDLLGNIIFTGSAYGTGALYMDGNYYGFSEILSNGLQVYTNAHVGGALIIGDVGVNNGSIILSNSTNPDITQEAGIGGYIVNGDLFGNSPYWDFFRNATWFAFQDDNHSLNYWFVTNGDPNVYFGGGIKVQGTANITNVLNASAQALARDVNGGETKVTYATISAAAGAATSNLVQTATNTLNGMLTVTSNSYTALSTVVSNGVVTWGNATFQPLLSGLAGYGTSGYVLSTTGSSLHFVSPPGGGSVTSVAETGDGAVITVSGSPVTTSGTLSLSLTSQNANTVLAGPPSGSAAAPSFQTAPTFLGSNIFGMMAVGAINIYDFGGFGLGENDDSAFSNMWQTCFNNGGGLMYVGPGTYNFSKTFHVPTNGTITAASCPEMTLITAGQGAVLFSYNVTPGTNDAAWFDTRPIGVVNLVGGFTIQNAASTGTAATLPDIFDGATSTLIEDVDFRLDGGPGRTNVVYGGTSGDNATQGVEMGFGGYPSTLRRCVTFSTGCFAYLGADANDITIEDCMVKSTAADCYAAVQVVGAGSNKAADNKFINVIVEMANGVPWGFLYTNATYGNVTVGCDFDDAISQTQIGILNGGICIYGNTSIGDNADGGCQLYTNIPGGMFNAFDTTLNGQGATLENKYAPGLCIQGYAGSTNDAFRYYTNGTLVTEVLSTGGIVAPTFSGNGAALTSLPGAQLTGTTSTAMSNSYLGGIFVSNISYGAGDTNVAIQIEYGTVANPYQSSNAVAIFQKISDPAVNGAFNPTVYSSATLAAHSANRSATAVIGDAYSPGGNAGSFVEGGRFMGEITGSANGVNGIYGCIGQAATASGIGYQFLVGNEGVVVNNSGSDAPSTFSTTSFGTSYLATDWGPNKADTAFLVNPYSGAPFIRGFVVGGGSVSTASFASYATNTYGLDLGVGTNTTAAIVLPNNSPIIGRGLANSQSISLEIARVTPTQFIIIGGGGTNWVGIGNSAPQTMLDVTGEASFGHLGGHSSGATPTTVLGAGAGTTPTFTADTDGSDCALTLTVTTGSSPTSSVVMTNTFAAAFAHIPHIVVSPGNPAAAALPVAQQPYLATTAGLTSTTGFTFYAGATPLAAATQYVWNFIIMK